MITSTLDLPLREYDQVVMHRIRFVGRQPSLNRTRTTRTLGYHTWNTEQFSRVRGWNVKNGELSELQMFRTETKSFSKQIKFIFYSGKETEK